MTFVSDVREEQDSAVTRSSRISSDEPERIATSPWPYLALLLRWRLFTLVLPLLVALLAGIVLAFTPRQYVASGSFVPQDAGPTRGSLGGIAAQLGMGQLGALVGSQTSSSPQFYAALMRSQEVLLAVADTTYATRGPKPFVGTLQQFFGIEDSDSARAKLATIRRLNEKVLALNVDRNTGIVHFTVTLKNPDLAGQVGRRFLDVVNDFNLRRRQRQVGGEREFVERRAAEALKDLREAEASLTGFRTRNRQFTQSPELQSVEAGLQRRVDLAQQVYVTLAQQFEMARVEAVRNTPVITTIDNPQSLIAPARRNLPLKVALVFLLTAFAGTAFAIAAERLRAARQEDRVGYDEFRRLRSSGWSLQSGRSKEV